MKYRVALRFATSAVVLSGIFYAQDNERIVVKKPYNQSSIHTKSGSTSILYHGGPVMTGSPANVYIIYYGDVPSGTQNIVNGFFTDLGTSANSYYTVNDSYYDSALKYIASQFNFSSPGMIFNDNPPSQGTHIGSKDISKIIQHAISAPGGLPADQDGVYFVITSPSVSVAGFCSSYCAYHTNSNAIVSGKNIRFAVVPDPGNQCGGCDGNVAVYHESVTPNKDPGADEMTDSIMHELSETVTDPQGNAWFTSNGEENGDLCNYTYGTPLSPGPQNGATANVNMNGHFYLIQKIWTNVTPQHCAP
ncbi:MAG TPA: hypothetical protein VF146_13640 [Bryobacteraceae bacterium]